MRQLVRLYCFWYGCLGTCCALWWHIVALQGQFAFPSNWWIVEAVFVLHALAAVCTFQRSLRHPWQPILIVTQSRIRLAKLLFSIATLNFILCLGAFIVASLGRYHALQDKTVPLILTSFLLQNTVYIALHWAFRPENLFSSSFIEALSNPLGSVLGLFLPRSKKH
jgi:hypothetical protein